MESAKKELTTQIEALLTVRAPSCPPHPRAHVSGSGHVCVARFPADGGPAADPEGQQHRAPLPSPAPVRHQPAELHQGAQHDAARRSHACVCVSDASGAVALQTIETLFILAFLVKDGQVIVSQNDDGEPMFGPSLSFHVA